MEFIHKKPIENESPSAYADRLGLMYTQTVDLNHKKKFGQYFTPISIANFMASYCHVNKSKIRILDPGAGLGILSCALIEYILTHYPNVTEIDLTAFETDEQLIVYADLSLNYLNEWVRSKGINIRHLLCKNDFILHNSKVLNTISSEQVYDIIISNPPYFKIPHKDPRAHAARELIHGQSNIYSIFMIVAAKLLSQNGQLIFITPRSFTSGEYFRTFREIFFSTVDINYVHLFNSRRNAFERDSVLQENIIVIARKKLNNNQLSLLAEDNIIQISSSTGIHDIEERDVRNYKINQLIDLNSEQKNFHIPSTSVEDETIHIFKNWAGSFEKYGLKISTGPVVDFRNIDHISSTKHIGYVPLIYLHNIDKMHFKWPVFKSAKSRIKGQYIEDSDSAKSLVSNDDYILLRRFSSKDDCSKLIATPYLSKWLPQYNKIGIENHLNYIYRKGGKLLDNEIYGIAGLLNSKLFDVYFRTFNGNINVSATELKHMPLPPLEQIVAIGEELIKKDIFVQDLIDSVVSNNLKS